MEIFIFIAVLVVLIVVHEFGHFIAAKLSGMRVDEFGLGYPPRIATVAVIGETHYTLNVIPFGGFVKIYGEDGAVKSSRAFSSRPRILQAITLIAGIAMNLLFAYVVLTAAFVAGTPRALAPDEIARASHVQLAVAQVLPGSPAALAGIEAGDSIKSATDVTGSWHAVDFLSFSDFIASNAGSSVTLSIERAGSPITLVAIPTRGLVSGDAERYALGVDVATIGILPQSLGTALIEGAQITWRATILTARGLMHFFLGVFTLSANLSQVSGPIGIATVVGGAAAQGFGNLLSIVALISINLALINLIPIPALDGGRLLFIVVEGILRRRINPRITQAINTTGFVFLILLMIVVTVHDIFKIIV